MEFNIIKTFNKNKYFFLGEKLTCSLKKKKSDKL